MLGRVARRGLSGMSPRLLSEHSSRARPNLRPLDPTEHLTVDRGEISLTSRHLQSIEVFPETEELLEQRLAHSSLASTAKLIRADNVIRAHKPSNPVYDGRAMYLPSAPACVFTSALPKSDGMFFPFSRYPKHAEGGERIKVFTLPVDALLDQDLSAFYVGTTPTQYGARFWLVYRSVVMLAWRGTDAEEFCNEHFTRLDLRRNRIAFFNDAGVFNIATKFAPDPAPVDQSVFRHGSPRPHVVAVAFAGDLSLSDSMDVREVDGVRAQWAQGGFICPECDEFSRSYTELKAHYCRSHALIKPFRCDHPGCTYEAVERHLLNLHKASHSDQKPYVCHFEGCTFAARNRSPLVVHLRTHTGDKPYVCGVPGCSYSARQPLHLSVHKRTHTGFYVYACEYPKCGFSSIDGTRLRAHQRTHNEVRPFACPEVGCSYGANQKAHLDAHLRTHKERAANG